MVARKPRRTASPDPDRATGDRPTRKPSPERKPRPERKPEREPDWDARGPDAGSPMLYLDETDAPVIGETEHGPRILAVETITVGGKSGYYAVIREINPATSAMCFAEAVRVDPPTRRVQAGRDGKALRYLIKRSPKPVILWVGSIEVIRKYRAFRISGERTLEKIESSRTINVRVINGYGITTVAEIPLMNMRATGDKAQWIDDLDLHGSSQTNMIKTTIIAMAESRDDDCIVIHGQGPVYLADDSLAFAARSVVYGSDGTAREDIRTDIGTAIKAAYLRYYDVTPRKEITDEEIKAGIAELRLALTESPGYPEIPAAFTGQLYTSPLATVNRELWTGLHLSGVRGSGKTRYATRWDSVQSRTLRGNLADIRPALPLGDTTGTVKGQQYRSANFGGYAITTDDVIKSGDSDYRVREQADKVQNLTRSFETGGSARGAVDRKFNGVVDGLAPELASCMKITSEKPIPGDSLQNRLIMLPHLAHTWGKGGYFSPTIAARLSAPESREIQHKAWSAYVYYLMLRADELSAQLANARRETATWNIESRQADRYAALVAGHYMFGEFAATFGIDYSGDSASAIAALRACAERQAGNSTPLAERFAEALRLEIVRGHLSYPGPPVYDPDGTQSATYSAPGVMVPGEPGEDGTREDKRELWGFTYDELGLVLGGNAAVARPGTNAKVLGYLVPPRADSGGKSGNSLTKRPLIAHKPEQFTALCEQLTRASRDRGWNFDRKDVIKSLQDTGNGNSNRISVSGKQDRYVYIDAEFALKTPDETE